MAPEAGPSVVALPQVCEPELSETNSGTPLHMVAIPETNQPPTMRSKPLPRVSRWPLPAGSSYTQFRLKDRKSTRLNSSHLGISYAVFCLKKKKKNRQK